MADTRYVPGTATAIVTRNGVALIGAELPTAVLTRIWGQLDSGRGLAAVLEALTGAFGTSLTAIPPFAVALAEQSSVRLAARGAMSLTLRGPSGTEAVSGAGVTTWSERVVDGATRVTLTSGTPAISPLELPMREGVVLAAEVTVDWADAAARPTPTGEVRLPTPPSAVARSTPTGEVRLPTSPSAAVRAAVPDFVPAAPAEPRSPRPDEDFSAPDVLSSTETPPLEGTAGTAATVATADVARASAPTPAPSAAEPRTFRPDEDFSAPDVLSSTESPPLEEMATDAPPAPADTDGPIVAVPFATTTAPSARQAAGLIDSSTVQSITGDTLLPTEATFTPSGASAEPTDAEPTDAEPTDAEPTDAEPTDAESVDATVITPRAPAEPDAAPPGDHDGETISVADARAMRSGTTGDSAPPPLAPPRAQAIGRLRLSTGPVVPLDRTVVIGRRPRSTRVTGTDLPHLVAVDSPQQDISRSHIEVRAEGDSILVTDLHTTNGTTLLRAGADPVRLHPGERTVVIAGDVIDLGDGVLVTVEEIG